MKSKETIKLFPDNFVWGTATSAYQIEGAAKEDGRGESVWDRFCNTPGMVPTGQTGEEACDHYHRFSEDIDIMAEIGAGAYRFSTAWPRIIPGGTGRANEKGLAFYDRLVDRLLENNITPYITLFHWDLPQVLEDKGGWRNRDIAYAFNDYVSVVLSRLSDRVSRWITLNEPPSVVNGYISDIAAPGGREEGKTVNQIIHHFLLGHGLALQNIRENAKTKPEIGFVYNPLVKIPFKKTSENIKASEKAWQDDNGWWLDPLFKGAYPETHPGITDATRPDIQNHDMSLISAPIDFLGLNVYSAQLIKATRSNKKGYKTVSYPEKYPRTNMGWPIAPDCIYYALSSINKHYKVKNYYITENGCALDDSITSQNKVHDRKRISFLRKHIQSAHRAIREGIPLAGYFVWSLLDNFEWIDGYSKRFGLVYIDFQTQERVVKDSAYWYSSVISQNGI